MTHAEKRALHAHSFMLAAHMGVRVCILLTC
jgi:hypothetical protein